jgi:drug/metabolite transporter (DMT)-like permease
MKYLFLALACTLFSVQFLFTKGFSRRASSEAHVGLWNGCVVSLCMALYLLPMNGFRVELTPAAGLIALLFALCAVTMSLCNIPAMRLGNMAVVTTYMLVGGMVLPFGYGVLWLHEDCSPLKLIAIAVLILAILPNLLGSKDNAQGSAPRSRGKTILFHGLCLVLFTLNGMTSVLSTMHSLHENKISSGGFTLLGALCQFSMTLLILVGYAIYRRAKGESGAARSTFVEVTKTLPTTTRALLTLLAFGFCFAVCNGVANIFSQESLAAGMPSSVQFPVISGSVIVLTALFGHWFFGEKINRYGAISLALSVVGSVLFMVA